MWKQAMFTLLAASVLIGCGGGEPPPPDHSALLAMADEADGTVDRVVHRCAVCALSMDGDEQYSSTFEGYTFHHCSAHCKETFDHDPAVVLARLQE